MSDDSALGVRTSAKDGKLFPTVVSGWFGDELALGASTGCIGVTESRVGA